MLLALSIALAFAVALIFVVPSTSREDCIVKAAAAEAEPACYAAGLVPRKKKNFFFFLSAAERGAASK